MASKRLKTGRNDHATKADVAAASAALRSDMSEMRAELRGEMSEMRAELRGEMSEMRAELRSEMRAQAVHFENVVVTQIRALGEVVVANAERHARELQEQDARLSARIDRLEDAVRQHSEELRALRAEVAGLRRDFEVRRDAGELRALEARVSTLESEVTRLKQRTGAR